MSKKFLIFILVPIASLFLVFLGFLIFNKDLKSFAGWNDCNPPCQSGEVCSWWGARPVCMPGAQCSSNADCATGYVCLNGRCTNEDAPGVRISTSTTTSNTTSSQDYLDEWKSSCPDADDFSLAWRNIPIDEVRRMYGDVVLNNIRNMACRGVAPSLIRELDLWTGNIHFEYKLPGGSSGNVNIWVYDLGTCTASWSGPGPAPYSPDAAARMITSELERNGFDCHGRIINQERDSFIVSPSISRVVFTTNLPRDSQGNYLAYVGQAITYTWSIPNAGTITSYYTADAPDNCPGGLTMSGDQKPWVANTASGTVTATVQACQHGRTYTITIKNNNQSVASIKIKIVDRSAVVGSGSGSSSSSGTYTFNPLDTSYYRGPLTLSFENLQRSTTTQQTTITQNQQTTLSVLNNSSLQTLTVLNSILERLTGILSSSSNLPSDVRNQITLQIAQSIQLVNSIIQQILNQVGGSNNLSITTSTSTLIPITTSTTTSTSTSTPTSTPTSTNSNFPLTARYIKYEINRNSWVSIREMEIYDDRGNKLTPVRIDVSSNWQAGHPHNAVGPNGLYDGRDWTVWNAGETSPSCGSNYISCPMSMRSAWVVLDLGSSKNISKVRVLPNGDASQQNDILSVSNDGSSYIVVGRFNGPAVRDNVWIEYPFPTTNIPTPTASLTVNGQHEIEVPFGALLRFDWSSTNGYGAFVNYDYRIDPSLPGYTYQNTTSSCGELSYVYSYVDPFRIYNRPISASPNGILPFQSNDIPIQYRVGSTNSIYCLPKAVLTFTYRVTSQYDPNKFAEDTVTIKVRGLPRNINEFGGFLSGWDYRVISINRGESKTNELRAVGLPGRSFYTPRLSVLNLPEGVNVSFGSWESSNIYNAISRLPVTINVGTNAQAGFYIIRFQAEPDIIADLGLIIN